MEKQKLIKLMREKIETFNETTSLDTLEYMAEKLGVFCTACHGKGYLEVTHEDSKEYIEACDECDYFGLNDDRDHKARIVAEGDGYNLDENGLILIED